MAATPPVMTVLRSHRAVIYSVVGAAIAVGICALVAVAWMLGWMPGRNSATAPSTSSTPARSMSSASPADALLPGETVITPDDVPKRTEPLMPSYSQPAAPPPAPAATYQGDAGRPGRPATARPAISNPDALPSSPTEPQRVGKREPYEPLDATRPGPTTPSFARREPTHDIPVIPPTSVATRTPSDCANCGVVSAITAYPPGLWEVRVRMDDGEIQAFRFRRPPSYRIGDRIRVDGTRLAYD